MGPRQVGKTTVVKQVLQDLDKPYLFFSADNVPATKTSWVAECWQTVRTKMKVQGYKEIIIVIDEIQKIDNWSSAVKTEWDADTFNDLNIKAIILGSSRVLLEKGLSESMMGRYEEIRMSHWSYPEMHEAFGISLEQYIYFGGYPGAAQLIENQDRWEQYVISSIIEATINKDILIDTPISKPALLRQTFELGAAYSGNILSLNKMLGSLQDAGNTVTLSNYINLLNDSGLLTGLNKFSMDLSRRKASIPKFQVFNNALKSVYFDYGFPDVVSHPEKWGHIFESAIGAHLLTNAFKEFIKRKEAEKPLATKITNKEYSVHERSREIKSVLNKKGKVKFEELFTEYNRNYIVVTFLSILIMAKNGEVLIEQEENFKELYISNRK